jgi:hypothetical protein
VTTVDDTWTNRDLPVLRAVVKIFSQTGRTRIEIEDIQEETGFDKPTTQLALQMLYQEPFFDAGDFRGYSGNYIAVGPPTSAALRLAGAWPTPENMVDRLIAAFEAASNDETLDEPERTRARRIWDGLMAGGYKVAIAAPGSAGGQMLSS